ncbi:nucleoporin Nup186/Nup192/Nup205 [Hysterangium stoloniferum]|nr:nucleoporin Nup186/Nup192/Nup205 [Hysterangium stoloniferum]
MEEDLVELAKKLRHGLLVETNERELQELYYDLERNRPRILKLFDVGRRSTEEVKDVENKKYKVNGKHYELKAQLVQPILFLADQLDCSEYYIAMLFAKAERRNPNLDMVSLVEKVIKTYHNERSALLECLLQIFQVTVQPASESLGVVLQKFAREVVGTMVPLESGRRGRFSEKLLLEIDGSVDNSAKLSNVILNATSTTNALGGQSTLSHDLLQLRMACLRGERRQLGVLLYSIASAHLLSGVEITKMIQRLADRPQDDMTFYILTTTLTSLSFPEGGTTSVPLYNDRAFVGTLGKVIDDKSQWKLPRLRAVVALQWSILIYMARHRDPELVEATHLPPGFSDDEVEKRVSEAVQGDVFPFLSEATQNVRPRGAVEEADRSLTGLGLRLHSETETDPDIVDEDFKMVILDSFERLITDFIKSMSSVIRRIKHRQEDVNLAASRANRGGAGGRSTNEEGPATAQRNDVAQLFEFIGVLYTCLPPDRGLKFWVTSSEPSEGKLFAFLRWATESRDNVLISAAFDMLAGIARGRSSAEIAYNFLISARPNPAERGHGGMLAGGGNMFSWSMLFSALAWWAENLPNSHAQHHQHPSLNLSGRWQQMTLTDPEALMLGAFLRLLRVVVKHAPAARIALYTMPDFRVVPTLLALLQHGIQLELKGVILDALAAFCEPGAGVQGVDICKNVWAALERAELINLRPGGSLATRGVENELEGVETPAQRYPATLPFLRLLGTLIHTPKDLRPQQMLVDYEPVDTIPDGLGQPTRLGGIGPYIRFVIDTVLLRANNREFSDPSDKWRMVDGSLCFVERCLASYNLRSLLSIGEETLTKSPEILRSFQIHPGFELLLQLLTDTPLRKEIVQYLEHGVDALENKTIKNVYFERVLLRILRIVHCVLDIQTLFIEILLPLLAQFEGSTGNLNFLISSVVPFDQLLNWTPTLVVKIALCTLYAEIEEIKLLSIRIITQLSESTRRISRLAVIFERTEESYIISDSFMLLLQRSSSEDASPSVELVDLSTGAGAPVTSVYYDLTHAIRLAILQLMLKNTLPDKPAPNVAHTLLGFCPDTTHSNQLAIQDPQAANSRRTCLHVILDLLNDGVPRQGLGDAAHAAPAFLITQPVVAERCYKLIYQLCTQRATTTVLMRYLRTREDFFARHLSVLPIKVPPHDGIGVGQIAYGDGTAVNTTVSTAMSFLCIRSWLLESTALELHMLTEMGQSQRASKLLALLFGSDAPLDDEQDLLEGMLHPFATGQSLIRIIELLQSLDLSWHDGLGVEENMQLRLFSNIDVSSCLEVDDTGCEVFDINALLSLMYQDRRHMQSQGVISGPHVLEQLQKEMNFILSSCAIENNRRRVQHAKDVNFESWKQLLDISLAKGFHRLPQDRRESILFDLLQMLSPVIQSGATQASTSVLLSEVVLTLVTKLRGDRQQQLILQSTFDDSYAASLPVDRLKGLLRSLLECLGASTKAEFTRGNLYAALVNFLHLVDEGRRRHDLDNANGDHLSISLSSISSLDSFETSGSLIAPRLRTKRSELETSTLATINKDVDGLVSLISTDAIDGTEVWKTVSFTLLDALVGLSRLEKPHRVLNILTRKGYLPNFIQGIKDVDLHLQSVLRPDPDNLNTLYVYEAKMALLIRIAQTQTGAEKLLENRVLHMLANCDFIEAQPEADQSFIDCNSFLPSAVYRYYQMLLPALELVNSIVATLGTASQAGPQTLQFLFMHRETFLISLREVAPIPTLQQIRAIHLLISISSYVTSLVEATSLRSPASGFGGLHSAILSLAAKYLAHGNWSLIASPSNDTEQDEVAVRAPGSLKRFSVFDAKVEDATDLLHEGIWMYLEAASDVNAPAPTISDSIEALSQVVNDLAKVLGEVTEISAKLSNKNHLELEEVDDIAQASGARFTEDLNMMQRRLLVYKELEKARQIHDWVCRHMLISVLDSLEILLLLIWRHINYYTSLSRTSSNKLTGPGQSAETFVSSVGRRPVLREDDIDTLLEHVRLDHRSREEYIEMMCRLIRNAVSEDTQIQAVGLADDIHGLGSW